MDEADMSQPRMDIDLREAMRVAALPARVVVATGECLHCGEVLADGLRWCNAGHRDAWEKQHARKGRK